MAMGAVLSLALAGCGGDETSGDKAKAAAGFPVKVTSCGVTTTYEKAPARAVSLSLNSTEVMIALGLEDRMAGIVANPEPLPEFASSFAKLPAIAKKEYPLPSQEEILSRNPDFILSNYAGEFAKETLGSRGELEQRGVDTYQTAGACGEGFGGRNTLDQAYGDIENLGKIFGVTDRAEKLVAKMTTEASSASKRVAGQKPVRAFSYDSGTDAPATSAGGLLGDLLARAGGNNLFSELSGFSEVSWEKVVKRDPEVIVITDYGETTAEEKMKFLTTFKPMSGVTAIKERRFVVLKLPAIVFGVRVTRSLAAMARAFHPSAFDTSEATS